METRICVCLFTGYSSCAKAVPAAAEGAQSQCLREESRSELSGGSPRHEGARYVPGARSVAVVVI